jgi:hypothetical protein
MSLQIDFQLARQGGQMMKAFEGHWSVQVRASI